MMIFNMCFIEDFLTCLFIAPFYCQWKNLPVGCSTSRR